MQPQTKVLRELIRESLYVVDEVAVADAITARAQVRKTVAESSFRSQQRGEEVRLFRRSLASLDKRVGNRPRNIAGM